MATSNIQKILDVIKNTHVMGENGLRDYHAARMARDANRCGTTPSRFKAMRAALKNHRVQVTHDGMGAIRVYNAESRTEYVAKP